MCVFLFLRRGQWGEGSVVLVGYHRRAGEETVFRKEKYVCGGEAVCVCVCVCVCVSTDCVRVCLCACLCVCSGNQLSIF